VSAADDVPVELKYLCSPPDRLGQAPYSVRPQILPLDTLSPMNFERLCFRLARLGAAAVQCRVYGVPGQAQHGIDLYVHRRDRTIEVVQCKRSGDQFTVKELIEAVDVFIRGAWVRKANIFTLAVTANLERTQLPIRSRRNASACMQKMSNYIFGTSVK
jgi:Restriction endonuclease